jgi:LacI family transcriptional regulator
MARPSVKDVAALAGVSLGTVSNVLNRPDAVRPSTRLRVERAIEELGFVRNASARHLREGVSRMLAYLVLDISNPFFTDVARGLEQVARSEGLGVFLCSSDHDATREDEYLQQLVELRVRGICVTAIDYENPRLRKVPELGVPLVLVDRMPDRWERDWCSVGVDDVAGGALAVTHLLELGHRTIGYIGGPTAIAQVRERREGAERALAANPDADELVFVETSGLTVAEGRRAGERLLGLPAGRRPTGVACANDLLALGLLQHLTQRGVRVPDDISIVGYDDIDFAAAAAVPLTSVSQPRLAIGAAAARLVLAESSGGGEHTHEHVQFEPELVVRASTSPPA